MLTSELQKKKQELIAADARKYDEVYTHMWCEIMNGATSTGFKFEEVYDSPSDFEDDVDKATIDLLSPNNEIATTDTKPKTCILTNEGVEWEGYILQDTKHYVNAPKPLIQGSDEVGFYLKDDIDPEQLTEYGLQPFTPLNTREDNDEPQRVRLIIQRHEDGTHSADWYAA